MIVALTRHRHAGRHDVAVLRAGTGRRAPASYRRVSSASTYGWPGGRQHLAVERAAVAVLVREPGRGEERPAAAAVPEEPRPHDAARVARRGRPSRRRRRRSSPASGRRRAATRSSRCARRRRQKRHRVGGAARRAVEQKLLAPARPPGRRDRRLTTPPIAPAPYSADATPLITSTCPRSIGGICSSPRPPTSPKSGRPSDRTRVYRPRMPWIRTLAAPSDGDVACTRMPPISFSIMTMSPGVMSIFSSISSRASTSTRIG